MAFQARLDQAYDQQQRFIEEALRINPVSIGALADMGQLWSLRGNCDRAKAAFQQTIHLLTTGGDPDLKMGKLDREDWASGLSLLASRCP